MEPAICQVGGAGIFLPLLGESEQLWPMGARAVLYFLGFCWCVIGIKLLTDVFMDAIQRITSRKVFRKDAKKTREDLVAVWHPIVGPVSLVLLGLVAPNTLLSVIELLNVEFFASSDVYMATGNTAFTMCVTTAVCMFAVPPDEVRRVARMPMYKVAVCYSIFVLFWLAVILTILSPDVVEMWEACLMVLATPFFTCLALFVDRRKKPNDAAPVVYAVLEATSAFASGALAGAVIGSSSPDVPASQLDSAREPLAGNAVTDAAGDGQVLVRAQSKDYSFDLVVEKGKGGGEVGCKYRTEDDTAVAGVDYDELQGEVTLNDGVSTSIRVTIKAQVIKCAHVKFFRLVFSHAQLGATEALLSMSIYPVVIIN